MWKFFQTIIVAAVMMLNVHFKWTPNSYLAAYAGVGVALIVTLTINKLSELLLALRRRRQRHHGAAHQISADPLPERHSYLISQIRLDRR